MTFQPFYICPCCGRLIQIQGSQCPCCHKEFTVEEVDNMFFVCPKCRHDKIEILLKDDCGSPCLGLTVQKAKYSAIVEIAQECVNSGLQISFICKHCGKEFDSTNFILTQNVE